MRGWLRVGSSRNQKKSQNKKKRQAFHQLPFHQLPRIAYPFVVIVCPLTPADDHSLGLHCGDYQFRSSYQLKSVIGPAALRFAAALRVPATLAFLAARVFEAILAFGPELLARLAMQPFGVCFLRALKR